MTEDEFAKLIDEYDLTYSYSDDHRVWLRGEAQSKALNEACKLFPREVFVRLWNAKVDRDLAPEARASFYVR